MFVPSSPLHTGRLLPPFKSDSSKVGGGLWVDGGLEGCAAAYQSCAQVVVAEGPQGVTGLGGGAARGVCVCRGVPRMGKKCRTGVFCVGVEIRKALNIEDGLFFSHFLGVFLRICFLKIVGIFFLLPRLKIHK